MNSRATQKGKVIKVKQIINYGLQYHPSEIVYTGATVGGVHVGGFHDEGNYYSVNGNSTNKYRLEYYGDGVTNEDFAPIDIIRLSPVCLAEAKQNKFISQFVDEDGDLALEHRIPKKKNASVEAAIRAGNADLAMNLAKDGYYATKLTKEECEGIKAWLCGYN